jgi:hypothetical protein
MLSRSRTLCSQRDQAPEPRDADAVAALIVAPHAVASDSVPPPPSRGDASWPSGFAIVAERVGRRGRARQTLGTTRAPSFSRARGKEEGAVSSTFSDGASRARTGDLLGAIRERLGIGGDST